MWGGTNQCLKTSKTHVFLRFTTALSQTATDCSLVCFPPKKSQKNKCWIPTHVKSVLMLREEQLHLFLALIIKQAKNKEIWAK